MAALAARTGARWAPIPAFRPAPASPAQEERRGDPSHGDLGTVPIVWSVRTTIPVVALTFDDGPDPEFTPRVLDVLRAHGVRATFNMMGWNCAHHPGLARAVAADGHEVGNHTWSHLDLSQVDPRVTQEEIRRGREEIVRATGLEPTWFRPPRGELTGTALRCAAEQHDGVLMWTVNGGLPILTPAQVVADRLVDAVGPGAIVGLHDGIGRGTFDRRAPFALDLAAHRRVEVEALDGIVRRLAARGYRFVTASELVALPDDRPAVSPRS